MTTSRASTGVVSEIRGIPVIAMLTFDEFLICLVKRLQIASTFLLRDFRSFVESGVKWNDIEAFPTDKLGFCFDIGLIRIFRDDILHEVLTPNFLSFFCLSSSCSSSIVRTGQRLIFKLAFNLFK